jgi:Arc/MetJ family transcription regulator
MMRTTIAIDDELLAKAQACTSVKEQACTSVKEKSVHAADLSA